MEHLANTTAVSRLEPSCPRTGLRCYRSVKAAREAHRKAGFRVRVFRCLECGWSHISREPKEHR